MFRRRRPIIYDERYILAQMAQAQTPTVSITLGRNAYAFNPYAEGPTGHFGPNVIVHYRRYPTGGFQAVIERLPKKLARRGRHGRTDH